MEPLEKAKGELKSHIGEIERYYDEILEIVNKINDVTLPGLINVAPTVQEKNAIFKDWNPMVLDMSNGLYILKQGIDRAHRKIL